MFAAIVSKETTFVDMKFVSQILAKQELLLTPDKMEPQTLQGLPLISSLFDILFSCFV